MWGHGRSLPPPLPTAAETEGAGEPALEMPSVSRAPWSPRAPPAERPGARSVTPDSNPAASHRAQCTLPGTGPDRHTCLSMDLNTMNRSRLVRISPALPNVKPCEERHATGERTVRDLAADDAPGEGLGLGAEAGHGSQNARFQGLVALFLKQHTMSVATPPAELGGSGFEIDTAAPQPAGGPIADPQESGSAVSLPTPLLSLRNQGLTQEAGEFFPRQGEIDSNPGVYIMNHPNREILRVNGGVRGWGALVTITPDLRCNLEKQESSAAPAIKDAENKDIKFFVSKLKEKPKSRREIGWKGRLTGERVFCTDLQG